MQYNTSLHSRHATLLPLAAYADTAAVAAAVTEADTRTLGDPSDAKIMVVVLTGNTNITSITMQHGVETDGSDQASISVQQTYANTPSPKATPQFLAAQLTNGQMALGALNMQVLNPVIGMVGVLGGSATFGVFVEFYNRRYTEYSKDTYAFEFYA